MQEEKWQDEGKQDFAHDDSIVHMAPSNMTVYASKLEQMSTSHVPRLVLRAKVTIVGDQAVGKSALTQKFHSGGHMYPKNYIMTTSVDFCMKEVSSGFWIERSSSVFPPPSTPLTCRARPSTRPPGSNSRDQR